MGQLWPIGDVWATIRAKMVNGRMQYSPNDPKVNYGRGGANWNSRVVVGVDGWGMPSYSRLAAVHNSWVTQESRVYMLLPGDSLYAPTYMEFNRRHAIAPKPKRKISMTREGLKSPRKLGSSNTNCPERP